MQEDVIADVAGEYEPELENPEAYGAVENFVLLVRCSGDWRRVDSLPEDDLEIVRTLIKVAGFEVASIAPPEGGCKMSYTAHDPHTGEGHSVPQWCSLRVLGHDGKENRFATRWLSWVSGMIVATEGPIYKSVYEKVLEIIPLPPIRLATESAMHFLCQPPLVPNAQDDSHFVLSVRDKNQLSPHLAVGIHSCEERECNGLVTFEQSSDGWNTLRCKSCGVLLGFKSDKQVRTYGDLREAMRALL